MFSKPHANWISSFKQILITSGFNIQKKVQAEKELTDLISELYVKLKQASEFYYKLEENYPEIARKVDE